MLQPTRTVSPNSAPVIVTVWSVTPGTAPGAAKLSDTLASILCQFATREKAPVIRVSICCHAPRL